MPSASDTGTVLRLTHEKPLRWWLVARYLATYNSNGQACGLLHLADCTSYDTAQNAMNALQQWSSIWTMLVFEVGFGDWYPKSLKEIPWRLTSPPE